MFDFGGSGRRRAGLGEALRELRQRSGLSGERLGKRCGISQSKISKIENGRLLPSLTDVDRILAALGVSPEIGAEVSALARMAHTEFENDRFLVRRGLHRKQRELAALEEASTEFRYFLPVMPTGLLQTPDYMAAALARLPGDHSDQIRLKLERQSILHDPAKSFTFLLMEHAVRFRLGPGRVMAGQYDRLCDVANLPNITLGIVPADVVVGRGPMNTFTVYDDRLATAELFNGVVLMRDPRDVHMHLEIFAFYARYARLGADAIALVDQLRSRV